MSAIDPNTVFAVLGSVAVAAVTAGPLWYSNRRAHQVGESSLDAARVATIDNIDDLKAIVVTQGLATIASIHRLEDKLERHANNPNAHQHTS